MEIKKVELAKQITVAQMFTAIFSELSIQIKITVANISKTVPKTIIL